MLCLYPSRVLGKERVWVFGGKGEKFENVPRDKTYLPWGSLLDYLQGGAEVLLSSECHRKFREPLEFLWNDSNLPFIWGEKIQTLIFGSSVNFFMVGSLMSSSDLHTGPLPILGKMAFVGTDSCTQVQVCVYVCVSFIRDRAWKITGAFWHIYAWICFTADWMWPWAIRVSFLDSGPPCNSNDCQGTREKVPTEFLPSENLIFLRSQDIYQ